MIRISMWRYRVGFEKNCWNHGPEYRFPRVKRSRSTRNRNTSTTLVPAAILFLKKKKEKRKKCSNFSSRALSIGVRPFVPRFQGERDKGKATFEVSLTKRTISPIPRTTCSCFVAGVCPTTRCPSRLICRDSNAHKYFRLAPLSTSPRDQSFRGIKPLVSGLSVPCNPI